MKISTLVPNYNDAETLERSVRSACDQNRHEVVVLDDASEDDSVGVVGRLILEYPQLRLSARLVHSDDWLRDMMLYARDGTTGDYCHFLAADDYLLPGFYRDCSPCTSGVILCGVQVQQDEFKMINVLFARQMLPPGATTGDALLPWATKEWTLPSGVGAVFRKDVAQWMCDVELWRIGPWNDSVGVPIIAFLFGVDHVPVLRAVHCARTGRYGSVGERTVEEQTRLVREACVVFDRIEAQAGRSPGLAQLLASSLGKMGTGLSGIPGNAVLSTPDNSK